MIYQNFYSSHNQTLFRPDPRRRPEAADLLPMEVLLLAIPTQMAAIRVQLFRRPLCPVSLAHKSASTWQIRPIRKPLT